MAKTADPSSSYSARRSTGKRALMVWLPQSLHQQLRIRAVREERTMQQVVVDALKAYEKTTKR